MEIINKFNDEFTKLDLCLQDLLDIARKSHDDEPFQITNIGMYCFRRSIYHGTHGFGVQVTLVNFRTNVTSNINFVDVKGGKIPESSDIDRWFNRCRHAVVRVGRIAEIIYPDNE
jgi:hypothetical protein